MSFPVAFTSTAFGLVLLARQQGGEEEELEANTLDW